MGYLYVMGVMSAGLLGVLLLALNTEQARQRMLRQALKNFPGFASDGLLFEGGAGLAIDRRRGMLCLIAAAGGDIRLTLVPFGDIVGCELVRDGRRVVHCLPVSENTAGGGPSAGAAIELRVHTRAARGSCHHVAVSEMPEALRWFYAVKVLARPAEPVASPAQPAATAAPAAAAPEPAPRPAADLDRVRERIGALIAPRLRDEPRFTIPERRLRDLAGLALPLVEFHKHMNQLRRSKAYAFATLSYSRNNESWAVARRR